MAHFAQIDENNIVTQVLVVPDNVEDRGQDYLANDLGLGGTWVQTSYNSRIRKNYAGVGFVYDSVLDAFIPPQPYDSWTLDETTCQWEAPVAYPTDGIMYKWNEETKDWQAIVNE
jgi:hypothetical protein